MSSSSPLDPDPSDDPYTQTKMRAFVDAMERSAALHGAMALRFPEQAGYAVALQYRIRFVMQFNAREAFHMLELRSSPQGHPAYRTVAQEMHRLIAEAAGHRALAEAMTYVDHGVYELERLEAERAAATRRGGQTSHWTSGFTKGEMSFIWSRAVK